MRSEALKGLELGDVLALGSRVVQSPGYCMVQVDIYLQTNLST